MDITELGLTAISQAALEAAGLTSVEGLVRHCADDLLAPTASIGPFELCEIVYRLNQHGYSLPPRLRGPLPGARPAQPGNPPPTAP